MFNTSWYGKYIALFAGVSMTREVVFRISSDSSVYIDLVGFRLPPKSLIQKPREISIKRVFGMNLKCFIDLIGRISKMFPIGRIPKEKISKKRFHWFHWRIFFHGFKGIGMKCCTWGTGATVRVRLLGPFRHEFQRYSSFKLVNPKVNNP